MTDRKITKAITHLAAVCLLAAVVVNLPGCASGSPGKKEKLAEAFHKMGRSFFNNGEHQRAFVEFQKSIEADPDHRDSHYYLGHIYWIRGDLDKAEEEFKTTLELDPEFSDAHNNLGVLYRINGKLEEAIAEYKKALDNPRYETPQFARFNLGNAYMDLEKNEAALEEFRRARSIERNYAQAYIGEARALLKLNRTGEAAEAVRTVLGLDPNNAQAYFMLGTVHVEAKANQKAREAFEKVIELSPNTELANNAKEQLGRLP